MAKRKGKIQIKGNTDYWGGPSPAGAGVPTAFSFVDQTSVAVSTVTTSAPVTLAGLTDSAAISVSGTNGAEYSINGALPTSSPGIVVNGDIIRARVKSSASFSTATTAVVTVGGVSDTFSVTTLAQDVTPAAFSFVDQTDVATSTTITSAAVVISGFNSPVAISVSGDTGAKYSIDGRDFTASAGTVSSGASIRAQVTSSGSALTATAATVTIGGVSDTFTVTTAA